MSRLRFHWLALFCVAVSACASTPAPNESSPRFTVARRSFESGEAKILVDVFSPTAAGTRPPILILHGAGGMLFDGPEMTRVAESLASAGFECYQVHYFDRTHTWFARQAVLLKLFPTWRATVQDAVDWVHTQRPEAPKVGIFGYSLGAFAAIETARRDPQIGAVVEHAGGFWQGSPEGPTLEPLPPILVIHGRKDARVPFAKYAQPLLDFLRSHHDPFTTHIYPDEGHNFSEAALATVRAQTVEFFQNHLPAPAR